MGSAPCGDMTRTSSRRERCYITQRTMLHNIGLGPSHQRHMGDVSGTTAAGPVTSLHTPSPPALAPVRLFWISLARRANMSVRTQSGSIHTRSRCARAWRRARAPAAHSSPWGTSERVALQEARSDCAHSSHTVIYMQSHGHLHAVARYMCGTCGRDMRVPRTGPVRSAPSCWP